jgi:hypothetical protein
MSLAIDRELASELTTPCGSGWHQAPREAFFKPTSTANDDAPEPCLARHRPGRTLLQRAQNRTLCVQPPECQTRLPAAPSRQALRVLDRTLGRIPSPGSPTANDHADAHKHPLAQPPQFGMTASLGSRQRHADRPFRRGNAGHSGGPGCRPERRVRARSPRPSPLTHGDTVQPA